MAWDYTHVELLKGIKRRASVPAAAGTWTDANILAEADRQIRSLIYPDMIAVNARIYTNTSSVSVVSGQATYRIPKLAFNSVLYEVNRKDSNGNESDTALIPLQDIPRYEGSGATPAVENVYAIDGALVRLLPTPTNGTGSTVFRYMRRPSKLVTTGYETISTVTSTSVLEVSAASLSNVSVDVISSSNPFQALSDSNSSTVTGTTRTLTTAVTHVAVGDYICAVGETPVPQVPEQAHDLLEQAVAVKILESMQAAEAVMAAGAILKGMRLDFRSAMTPRVADDTVKSVNRNSPMRSSGSRYGGRW